MARPCLKKFKSNNNKRDGDIGQCEGPGFKFPVQERNKEKKERERKRRRRINPVNNIKELRTENVGKEAKVWPLV